MECSKCGCTKIKIAFDSRGLAEARCADCGALIKKMKTQELADYYEARIAELGKSPEEVTRHELLRSCRYCTENYVMLRGSMRLGREYIPIKVKFCPMCGRELERNDRRY